MTPSTPEDPQGHTWITLADYGAGQEKVCQFCGTRRSQVNPEVKCMDLRGRRPLNRVKHEYDPFN